MEETVISVKRTAVLGQLLALLSSLLSNININSSSADQLYIYINFINFNSYHELLSINDNDDNDDVHNIIVIVIIAIDYIINSTCKDSR